MRQGLASFDLFAAIDLRGGRVVRLREGDFERETAYADDPASMAADFAGRGVRWLHVVDLDGARAGEPAHESAIADIVAAVGGSVSIEVGGGLRTLAAVAAVLDAGAARAVVGSAAIADPGFARELVRRHGAQRIAIAIDIRDGLALGGAWRAGTPGKPADQAIDELAEAGVEWFEVTAIERDGSLEGPDLGLLQAVLARAAGRRVVAAGGIATVDDMLAVWTLGCAGAIVGRGLYEGTFALEQGIRASRPGA